MGGICSRCCRRAPDDSSEKEIELSSFVHIDPKQCGPNVKAIGDVVSGTGCALASAALHQTKSYFEVTVKTSGTMEPHQIGLLTSAQPRSPKPVSSPYL